MNLLHLSKSPETAHERATPPGVWHRVRSAAQQIGRVIIGPPLSPTQLARREDFINRYTAVIAADDKRIGYEPVQPTPPVPERDAA